MSCQSQVASSASCAQRFREHLLAHLVCPGRHTITSLITTCGKQHQDWSADYDLYSHQRVHPEVLFEKVRSEVESFNEPDRPLAVAHFPVTVPQDAAGGEVEAKALFVEDGTELAAGTLALLGLGLVSLGVAYRRRRRKAA